jgi:hypothetical protein
MKPANDNLTGLRALQCAVALAVLVPLGAGLSGMLEGPAMLAGPAASQIDSHFRYLSGLLFGIGLAFAVSIPHIERHAARFRLLAAIVVIGGLGRLYGIAIGDPPTRVSELALVMELLVTPALALWQHRVAKARG